MRRPAPTHPPRRRPGWTTRLRRLRRRRGARWALAGLAAIVAGLATQVVLADVRAELAAVERAAVVVATRAVPAGTPLGPDDVGVVDWPAALVPDGALGEPPLGRAAAVDLAAGEPVLEARLAPPGVSGRAAGLPAGTRAIGVPLPPHAVPLRPGDRVDVLATVEPTTAGTAPAVVLVVAATVVDVAEGRATVAVPAADVTRVAAALAHGVVDLVLTPG